ncbi:MAG: hypothetical protein EOO01_44200 [Chitinophagaceae bacterium]|nr:MAG: hypothetical protein EOO01_44200 [Chitinophagaceae bacterium]
MHLTNPVGFSQKDEFISVVSHTSYDVVIMEVFLIDQQVTAEEIQQLKHKANGGKRMIICYMSIGEAEDYR